MPSTQETIRKTLLQFYQNPIAQVSFELLLSLGAVIFFALFAIRPTLLTMSDLLKEIQDKKDLSVQLERKIAALATVQSEYIQLQRRLPVLDQALPNSPQLVYSLKVIEKMASDSQLAIEGISVNTLPDEVETIPNYKTVKRIDLPATVSVTGSYPNIRLFIESLQNYRRTFVIDTIVFGTSEEKGASKLSANITIYIPYYTTDSIQKTK
jgi:Tfp pilus assembly protein PilO